MQILIKAVASEKTSPRTSPKKKENGVADKEISDVSHVHTHVISCALPFAVSRAFELTPYTAVRMRGICL